MDAKITTLTYFMLLLGLCFLFSIRGVSMSQVTLFLLFGDPYNFWLCGFVYAYAATDVVSKGFSRIMQTRQKCVNDLPREKKNSSRLKYIEEKMLLRSMIFWCYEMNLTLHKLRNEIYIRDFLKFRATIIESWMEWKLVDCTHLKVGHCTPFFPKEKQVPKSQVHLNWETSFCLQIKHNLCYMRTLHRFICLIQM